MRTSVVHVKKLYESFVPLPSSPPSELVDKSVLSKLGEVTAVDVLDGFATALSKKRKAVLSAIRVDGELRER